MRFTRTAHQPAANAPVTVSFAGLMLVSPAAGNTCGIGVHRWASRHMFQVILTVLKPNRPPTSIRLYSGYFDQPCFIKLAPDHPSDLKAYAATQGALERNDQNARDYPLDYRWALNLSEYHDADYNDGARPIITLKTGVLYTPNLSPGELDPELFRYSTSTTIPLKYFSADLAAAITPPANTKVKIEWSELGAPAGIYLPRENDPEHTTYTISFINDPPTNYPAPHDELDHYYKVLTVAGVLIPEDERWELRYPSGRSTDRIPCMPIILEGD